MIYIISVYSLNTKITNTIIFLKDMISAENKDNGDNKKVNLGLIEILFLEQCPSRFDKCSDCGANVFKHCPCELNKFMLTIDDEKLAQFQAAKEKYLWRRSIRNPSEMSREVLEEEFKILEMKSQFKQFLDDTSKGKFSETNWDEMSKLEWKRNQYDYIPCLNLYFSKKLKYE